MRNCPLFNVWMSINMWPYNKLDFECELYIRVQRRQLSVLVIFSGDLFVLVYSIDSRDSFNEVRRILDQIYASKNATESPSTRSGRRSKIPLVIVGNKSDCDADREIGSDELSELSDQCPCSGYIETSARNDQNIEEIFQKLFVLAKLPVEMSPSLHRKVQPMYTGGSTTSKDSSTGSRANSFRRTVTIRRRLSDACGAVAPHARRPSIRTDLLMWQTKRSMSQDSPGSDLTDSSRCVIQ